MLKKIIALPAFDSGADFKRTGLMKLDFLFKQKISRILTEAERSGSISDQNKAILLTALTQFEGKNKTKLSEQLLSLSISDPTCLTGFYTLLRLTLKGREALVSRACREGAASALSIRLLPTMGPSLVRNEESFTGPIAENSVSTFMMHYNQASTHLQHQLAGAFGCLCARLSVQELDILNRLFEKETDEASKGLKACVSEAYAIKRRSHEPEIWV